MSISLVDGLAGILAIVIIAFLRDRQTKVGNHLPYPPGPKGLPLIGNVNDMATDVTPQELYAKWGREFSSDIIHLKMLNTHMIVVNKFKVATELFDRRSSLYSDRPIMPMLHDLVQLNWFSAMMRYGDTWRSHRRVMHQNFHPKDPTDFERKQLKSIHELLTNLITKPRDSFAHVRLMMATLLLSITYGVDPKTVDHPWIVMAENTITAAATAATPGRFLVDTFPILKYVPDWMPGAGFKARAKAWNKMTTACADEPFHFVKEQMKLGNEAPSVTATALRAMNEKNDNTVDEEVLKGVSAIVYAAGADTTISVINTLIMGLLLYPETQKKAYAEIDRVIGNSRLPEFGDIGSLPYVTALVKEALRWRPAAPLAIPHRLVNDDVYDGMFFPAGSIVVGNVWFMLTDPSIWSEPTKFRPERFLTSEGEIDPKVGKPEDIAFGFGRRSCPGRSLAVSSTIMLAACLIATVEITPIIGENGRPILPNPEDEGSPGLVSSPAPFQCDFKPRSQHSMDLVNEAVAAYA